MKFRPAIIDKSLYRLKSGFWENDFLLKLAEDEPPLHLELFSAAQMEQHGKTLAGLHLLAPKTGPEQRLLSRLYENEVILRQVHKIVSEAVKANRQITPAGEWLLDNYYLVETQIMMGRRHFPKSYSKELPLLLNGPSAGLPRVYDIAKEIISHGEGNLNPESLRRCVTAYQTITPLKLGELWAIPIMLRLALIENLRRIAARIAVGLNDRDLADSWAGKMKEVAVNDPKSVILAIADMARSDPPISASFVSELVRQLQGQSQALSFPLTWIEQRLSESNQTIVQVIQNGNRVQAADQVSISNSVGSLRLLSTLDWRDFVESMSHVEHVLHEDPAGVFALMDFATRDRYRHVIEDIAKIAKLSEIEVARQAVELARKGAELKGRSDRMAHVGYYLIGKGLSRLETQTKTKYAYNVKLRNAIARHPLFFYLGSIIILTLTLSWCLLEKAQSDGIEKWQLLPLGLLLILCTSYLTVALVNWLSTLFARPSTLPRLDYSKGIPPDSRTIVVVPTIISSPEDIEELTENLEVRFLANRDKNLHFGLLTDFKDAEQEKLETDKQLIQLISQKIKDLNDKYPGKDKDTFFLFHRPRKWNPVERVWMGYERKRGKLLDLNSVLRGENENVFSHIIGKKEVLKNIKYVITLDTDTQLPRDAARQFIGAMSHPLNKPEYDSLKRRVKEGYSILQPRVAMSLPEISLSRYSKLFGSEAGLDPYTRAVSDVYQDLFGEGSFIGKGIYDVDFIIQILKNRLPENRILSHDLLEGCYARSGLLSDVLLFEEYPASYKADVNRRSRWIRGDWQLLPWLFPVLPKSVDNPRKNPLSILSWWKIFDNLRRSLIPTALTLLLMAGLTILPSSLFWTLVVIGIILIPSMVTSVVSLFQKPEEMGLRRHLKETGQLVTRQFHQAAFMLISLPYEAFFSMDAILRTCWRLIVSKKRFLVWNTATRNQNNTSDSSVESFRTMWISPFMAIATAIFLAVFSPFKLVMAGPIIGLWFVFPYISWWISRPLDYAETKLSDKQSRFLRELSRKTWHFFETFVGNEDNWLPPDNFQEIPSARIAHRTSPTNIGLSLLANLSAYDFGYIYNGELLDRTSNAFKSMQLLEKYRGHFFNWYDTQTLKPLPPQTVSSVDSGNLAGSLLTFIQGLLSLPDQPVLGPRLFDGIDDTFQILSNLVGKSPNDLITPFRDYLNEILKNPPETLVDIHVCLEKLTALSAGIVSNNTAGSEEQFGLWTNKLARQCQGALDELTHLVPWILLPDSRAVLDKYPEMNTVPSLREIINGSARASEDELKGEFSKAAGHARERIALIEALVGQAEEFTNMEYDFLYDKDRHLLTVSYNVQERRRDKSYYDLLASEARLTSFIAIAQNKIPQESWFALGRLITTINGDPILLSWAGSMFEYLMPLIIMPEYSDSLLFQTYKAAVNRQIEYGKERGVPWGISESGYNSIDAMQNYQYRSFGVPGTGLKRGLSDDLVIAPYATCLALIVMPEKACANLAILAAEGFLGKFGFYEAIDYTAKRLPRGQSKSVIRSFMAHHQGMSLLSFAYSLLDRPMQKRFVSLPSFQATLLLLQERVPKLTSVFTQTNDVSTLRTSEDDLEMPHRIFKTPNTPIPEINLLSNGGQYRVMITNAGGGYSCWKDIAVTRWREDTTCDNWGAFCYLRDASNGNFWSATYQPTLKQPEKYEVVFSNGRAEFRRRDHDIDTYMEIAVSPEDDIELRRLQLTNRTRTKRIIDVTSYAEVVLAPGGSDLAHPAFSNLFVQTEIIEQRRAILCKRRPGSAEVRLPWMFHLMTAHDAEIRSISYETDRMRFIGRGNTLVSPYAMTGSKSLSNSQGSVLDPIVAVQYQIILEPEGSATIDMITGVGATREGAIYLIEKYQDKQIATRVFELARTHNQVLLHQINASEPDAQLYTRLTNSIIFSNSSMRAESGTIMQNHRGQSGLWGYSISGDLPIVLLQIEDQANLNLVRQLVQAHAYWRSKGLAVDLVIWNEVHGGYHQLLQDQIIGLITAGIEANLIDQPGGIFVRTADQISDEDRILFESVARVVLSDARGTLSDQLNRQRIGKIPIYRIKPKLTYKPVKKTELISPRTDLVFNNGIGGFTNDGREYIITISKDKVTPAPWVNVIANKAFGTVISENGAAYTWAMNSHEYRLTPWNNDLLLDQGGEAIYIRDEETGHFWSPTPMTDSESELYICRHGFGYSVFEHKEGSIVTELWVYVAIDAPVKFAVLKVKNESQQKHKLSATSYVEWVLGDLRHKYAMHINTSADSTRSAIYAVNPYNSEFSARVAFLHTDEATVSFTCDRTEFIGRNGTLKNPAAMLRAHLSHKKGAALDPCAAIMVPFELSPGQEREIIFRLGSDENMEDAISLIDRFRGSATARSALEGVWQYWNNILGAVQVDTPDKSVNILANGWLIYQTLACRIRARSGFYQSSGAYGFRDQLQDAMSLIHCDPGLLRELLLLFASRQFKEGDVQHWWHPPAGRGVRTRCSDDYLWLPLAVCRYVTATGDTGILEESVPFLSGRPVNAEEESYYDLPDQSKEKGTLYEHCKRSILHGLKFGDHGLPLIGTCDWNDGMNKVGYQGKGESVWLGFFLYDVLNQFIKVAQLKNDAKFIDTCRNAAEEIQKSIEMNAWDGEWYLRAYFDNGAKLGSAGDDECKIDSIAQSWSVLSGAGNADRSHKAMESVNKRLVRPELSLVQLLDPPFDKSDLNPGYIKGYVPGIRENGGQYTHAAIWSAMAFAKMGDSEKAWRILSMINPVNHGKTPEGIEKYKIEPYVISADIYSLPPHDGRGGWTWYTGSAGWMYRLIIESILGLRLENDKLYIEPCLPKEWESFRIQYRYKQTTYRITVTKIHEAGVKYALTVDGTEGKDKFIHLVNDNKEHSAEVKINPEKDLL